MQFVLIKFIPGVTGNDFDVSYFPTGGTGKIWFTEKDEEVLIPQGLRERDFKLMPSREQKKSGPVFGTNAGKYYLYFSFHFANSKPQINVYGIISRVFWKRNIVRAFPPSFPKTRQRLFYVTFQQLNEMIVLRN